VQIEIVITIKTQSLINKTKIAYYWGLTRLLDDIVDLHLMRAKFTNIFFMFVRLGEKDMCWYVARKLQKCCEGWEKMMET